MQNVHTYRIKKKIFLKERKSLGEQISVLTNDYSSILNLHKRDAVLTTTIRICVLGASGKLSGDNQRHRD